MPLLSLHSLSLTLNTQEILKHISLDVEEGEILGVIGPNGSGKTTLFNVLSGFLRPTTGTIRYRDEDITKFSPAERARRGVGRVFQNFGIFREMTLGDLLRTVCGVRLRTGFQFAWIRTEPECPAFALLFVLTRKEVHDVL